MADLPSIIEDFSRQVNDNPRMSKILNGWNRSIWLEPVDGEPTCLEIRSGIASLALAPDGNLDRIELSGRSEILEEVFTGRRNPASEVLDGRLEVIGSDKDQVKLDAIALVLWGA